MKSFDNVVERLTERLKGDPELRAEVSNELRGHLEESAQEFRAAGRSEEEARGEAVRAMGDEREVTEGLWEGNKGRMKRRRVARWVVGGTLVSGAGVAVVTVGWGAMVSLAVVLAMLAGSRTDTVQVMAGTAAQGLARYVRAGQVAGMSQRDREIFEAWEGTPGERVEKARRLAEGATGEERAVLWANYAAQVMGTVELFPRESGEVDRAGVERAVGVMEAAKGVEPENGFYAMGEAAMLLQASTRYVEVPEDKADGFEYVSGRTGKVEKFAFDRFEVTDRGMYERGLAALREAAGAAYLDSHVTDFMRMRLRALPPGRRLGDEVIRALEERATPLTYLNGFRGAVNVAGGRVVELAKAGKTGEAVGVARDGQRVARMMAERARPLIELLVAAGMYNYAMGQEAEAYHLAGDRAAFERVVGRIREMEREVDRAAPSRGNWKGEEVVRVKRAMGVVGQTFLFSGIDVDKVDPGPERRAEYAVADQLAAAVWAGVMAVVGVGLAVGAVRDRVRGGRWPGGLFVGWGRLARVIWVAVGGPVGVYAVYAAVTGGRGIGASWAIDRLVVEYAAVGAAVAVVLRVMMERALRQRAREVGVVWEERKRGKGEWVVGIGLAAAVVAFEVVWCLKAREGALAMPTGMAGLLFGAVVAGYGVSWLMGIGGGSKRKRVPGWVGPVVVTGMLVAAAWVVGGSHGYSVGRVMAHVASGVSGVVAGLVAVVLVVGWAMGRRGEARVGALSRGLSVAPVVLGAAVVLVLVAGVPARVVERREVGRVEAGGGIVRMDREVEMSAWRGVRDWVVGRDETGKGEQGI